MKLPFRLALASLAIALLGGCAAARIVNTVVQPVIPSYHQDDGVPIRRVAVLPIYFDEQQQVSPSDLDLVFHAELTKTSAFEIIPISRQELSTHFGIRQLSSVQVIPRDLLTRLMADYAVEGVLFTDLTHYSPYRPVSIGVRCKLVDARSGVERWVFDHLFDSGNPDIAVAAKNFAIAQDNEQLPIATDGSDILQSPMQFGKYVAHETYRSLLAIQSVVPPEKNQ
jgi:hypothetical protein